MENIKTLITYNTDTNGSWGIGELMIDSKYTYDEVLKKAIEIKAFVIVKPSRGNWYIKGINNKKNYDEIKNHLELNQQMGYKKKSITRLIKY